MAVPGDRNRHDSRRRPLPLTSPGWPCLRGWYLHSPNETLLLPRSQPPFSSPGAGDKDPRSAAGASVPPHPSAVGRRQTATPSPQKERLREVGEARDPQRLPPPRAPPRDLPTSGFLSAAAAPPPAPRLGEAVGQGGGSSEDGGGGGESRFLRLLFARARLNCRFFFFSSVVRRCGHDQQQQRGAAGRRR